MILPHILSDKPISVNLNEYEMDWGKTVSKPQRTVSDFLHPFWKFDKILSELRIPGSLYRLDIVNISKMIVVEVSPSSVHAKFNPWIHKDRLGFLKKIKADEKKRLWVEKAGFQLVELVDEDIKNLSKELFLNKFQVEL